MYHLTKSKSSILRDCTKHGDLVFDPLLGSSTLTLAAGRARVGVELDTCYLGVSNPRLQGRFTSKEATALTLLELRHGR